MKYIALILILLFSFFTDYSVAFAQQIGTPSVFYCVGNNPQPPCATIAPSKPVSPTINPTATIPPTSTTSGTPSITSPAPSTNPCVTQSAVDSSVSIQSFKHHVPASNGVPQQFFKLLLQLFQQLANKTPTPTPTSTPTPTLQTPTPTINPCPSATPKVSVAPSIVTPSITPSTPTPTINPCTTQNTVSSKSTSEVHTLRHHSSSGFSQFFQFFLQLFQLLLQLLGNQTGHCPPPFTTLPSVSPIQNPTPTIFGTSPSPSPSPSSGNPSSGAPSPSNGAGNGNNPSPSSGSGNNNNPSPSSGSGNSCTSNSQCSAGNTCTNGTCTPNGGGTQKDAFSAPKVTEKTALSGTMWIMTITWPPVTTTTQGNKASPTAYNLSFTDSSGKTIHGMTNTSTHPISDGKTDYCTSATCTQTVTATSTKNAANTNGSDPITLLSSGKATVLVSAAATATILASANGTATVQKPATTAACKTPAPDVVGDDYKTAESTLTAAKYTYQLTNGTAGNIIQETPQPGIGSCSVVIETDNISTPTNQCSTAAQQSTRCIDTKAGACSSLTIAGHAGAYCELSSVHHNGMGGYYSSRYCPGQTGFECWVPGATSAKTAVLNPVLPSCTSIGGVCRPTATLPVIGGFTVLQGTCSSGNTCIKQTQTQTCTGAGYSCFNSATAATAVPVSRGIVTHSTGSAAYDTSCGSGKSCYEIMTCASAGYQCLTQATINSLKGKVTVTHSTAAAKYDKYCAAQGLSYTGCYQETTTKAASVPNSAVAVSSVNKTVTAPSLWTTITSSIWHWLTSL